MSPAALAASPASEAASAVPAAASAIPFLRHDDAAWDTPGMGVGNALVAVLLVAAAAAWLAHRAGWLRRGASGAVLQRAFRPASGDGLRVLESTRLTPKASAHVLQWAGRRVLVVCTDQSATVVAQEPCAPAAPEVQP
ncbi:MAG TPA: flagellar biosynthetic protein FliO [Burkholderiaceae bacterium]